MTTVTLTARYREDFWEGHEVQDHL